MKVGWGGRHIPLIPVLERQSQADLSFCEFDLKQPSLQSEFLRQLGLCRETLSQKTKTTKGIFITVMQG